MIELLLILAGAAGWSHYGGDEGGSRYVIADQVDRGNVGSLEVAWEFHSGDMADKPEALRHSALEVTPILVRDKLVYCTPFNRIIALDPGRGTKLWEYDARIGLEQKPANQYLCRGVSYWQDPHASGRMQRADLHGHERRAADRRRCRHRSRVSDFGNEGQVHIDIGMSLLWPGEFQITSSPAVIGDVVIVGSAIGDNERADSPRGTVRAFDARTGAPRWTFDPIPDESAAVVAERLRRAYGPGERLEHDVGRLGARSGVSADVEREPRFLRR